MAIANPSNFKLRNNYFKNLFCIHC